MEACEAACSADRKEAAALFKCSSVQQPSGKLEPHWFTGLSNYPVVEWRTSPGYSGTPRATATGRASAVRCRTHSDTLCLSTTPSRRVENVKVKHQLDVMNGQPHASAALPLERTPRPPSRTFWLWRWVVPELVSTRKGVTAVFIENWTLVSHPAAHWTLLDLLSRLGREYCNLRLVYSANWSYM